MSLEVMCVHADLCVCVRECVYSWRNRVFLMRPPDVLMTSGVEREWGKEGRKKSIKKDILENIMRKKEPRLGRRDEAEKRKAEEQEHREKVEGD